MPYHLAKGLKWRFILFHRQGVLCRAFSVRHTPVGVTQEQNENLCEERKSLVCGVQRLLPISMNKKQSVQIADKKQVRYCD